MKKNIYCLHVLILITYSFLAPINVLAAETDQPKELDPQLVSCLKEKFGEETFNQIQSGQKPSDEQIQKGDACFKQFGAPKFQGSARKLPQKADFSSQTAACLEKTLGADFTDQMAKIGSQEEASAFHAKTKSCFGMAPPKGEGDGQNPEDLQKTKDCLVSAVGQAQVDKMFTGERPEPGSEIFNKIESSGCFKKMNFAPKDGPKENLSPETESCIKGILGSNMMKEPNEDQKKQIGEKCFKGRGPNDQGQGGRVSLPPEFESCLKSKVGDKYKSGPDSLSESEKQSMGECFQKNNFQPAGIEGSQNGGSPEVNMDPTTKSCIEGIMGGNMKAQPSEDQRKQIGEKCFKGPGPQNQQGSGQINGGPNIGGNILPGQDNPCVNNIIGDQKEPFSQELRERIGRECFNNQPPTNQTQPQGPTIQTPLENQNPPANSVPLENQNPPKEFSGGQFPGGCADQACADIYCSSHPDECGQNVQTESRFSFPLFRRLFRLFR